MPAIGTPSIWPLSPLHRWSRATRRTSVHPFHRAGRDACYPVTTGNVHAAVQAGGRTSVHMTRFERLTKWRWKFQMNGVDAMMLPRSNRYNSASSTALAPWEPPLKMKRPPWIRQLEWWVRGDTSWLSIGVQSSMVLLGISKAWISLKLVSVFAPPKKMIFSGSSDDKIAECSYRRSAGMSSSNFVQRHVSDCFDGREREWRSAKHSDGFAPPRI